jgi:hypothetical protein
VWVVLLVLHEAIVEVWRRRSGVRVVLTGIVRVWCRLGLVLALAVLALALAVLALAVRRGILLLVLLRVEGETTTYSSRAAGSAGLGRTSI